jgi:hypothetical protein
MKLTGSHSVLAALVLQQLGVVRAYEIVRGETVTATERRGEIRVHCPSRDHLDSHPSCDLRPADNVWQCRTCPAHGGILTLAIAASYAQNEAEAARWFADKLGIELPPNRQQRHAEERAAHKSAQRIVATYPYRDLEEVVHYEVLRYGPVKDFRVRHRGANGKAVWNLNGVARIPFAWSDMADAMERNELIIVCEGEKAAIALSELGLIATCSAGGAKWPWSPDFCAHFAGARVVFVADNDEAGRNSVNARSQMLLGVAREVRAIMQLPEVPAKGDCHDLVKAGWTAEQFAALFATAAIVKPAPAPIAVAEGQRESATSAPPSEPIDGAELLDEIATFIRRYVVVTGTQAQALALWVVHTHAISAFDATPYLNVFSPEKQSGKTRLLEVLELIVANPWKTGRISAAALVRSLGDEVTLLLDESDAAFGGEKEYSEALRGALNEGFYRGGCHTLCSGQGANIKAAKVPVFGPKAIAGIGRKLPDTVRDRAIPIELQRKTKDECAEKFRRLKVRPLADPLRQRIARWVSSVLATLRKAEPNQPQGLSDRAEDVWEPLFAIADCAGDEWPGRARNAAIALSANSVEEDGSLGVRLLVDCREAFNKDDAERLHAKDLLERLCAFPESPWATWHRGNPMTLRALAKMLAEYRIRSKQLKIGGVNLNGYERTRFEDTWKRYAPAPCSITASSNSTDSTDRENKGESHDFQTLPDDSGRGCENDETPMKSRLVESVEDRGDSPSAEEVLSW